MTIYLENGDELVLEGCAPDEPIYIVNGSTLGYAGNQHDYDVGYIKDAGGVAEIHAGITLHSTKCYFNGTELEDNTTGAAYYIDTIGAAGAWIVDGWEPEGPTDTSIAYITKNGLKIVTNRLVTNLFNGNQRYSGKLDRVRAYIDLDADGVGESYLDLEICTAYCTSTESSVDYIQRTMTDEVYDTTYYATPMIIRAIVPEGKYGYDGVTDTFRFFTTTSDTLAITSLDLISETASVFATATITGLEIEDNERKFIEWEIGIGND